MRILSVGFRFFYLSLLVCSSMRLSAQEVDLEWLLGDLVSDTSEISDIVFFQPLPGPAYFWPKDLKVPENSIFRPSKLMKSKNGLFTTVDGTGRVYKITNEGGITFTRIDSTRYFGYNFGSYDFIHNDTLISFGGYGFWRHNGHLRYYKPDLYGWEVIALNREIPIGIATYGITTNGFVKGYWHDRQQHQLYYVEKNVQHVWDKSNTTLIQSFTDSSSIHVLDLNTKNWSTLGKISPEAFPIIENAQCIASLPWGELTLNGPRAKNTMYLLNYSNNTVYQLKRDKASSIISMLYGNQDEAYTVLSYYKDSTLYLVNTVKEKLAVPLTLSDFTQLPITIYTPVKKRSEWLAMSGLSLGVFISGIVLSLLGAIVLVTNGKRKLTNGKAKLSILDQMEKELILTVYAKPNHAMLTDEINYLLGTSKRSMEIQKKQRSDVIKSINEKYKELTRDDKNLINQERLENDRRLMRYVIHTEQYKKISNLLESA
jgi:hypothetical protein